LPDFFGFFFGIQFVVTVRFACVRLNVQIVGTRVFGKDLAQLFGRDNDILFFVSGCKYRGIFFLFIRFLLSVCVLRRVAPVRQDKAVFYDGFVSIRRFGRRRFISLPVSRLSGKRQAVYQVQGKENDC
jgi:hypothetical protein